MPSAVTGPQTSGVAQPQGQGADVFPTMTVIDGKCFLREGAGYVGPEVPVSESFAAAVKASGLTTICTTVGGSRAFAETAIFIEKTDGAIGSRPDLLLKVQAADDLEEAKRSGRLGVIYDVQGTSELGGDSERVPALAKLGVRVFQMTYNKAALVGDGCLESRNAGLSEFGRNVISLIEAEKCLLDLSHAGKRTTAEAIAAATRPCAITHAGCNSINQHPRNVDDSEIRAVAEKGGVFGIYFMSYLRREGQCHREDVIAHVEHAIDIAGEDHVSIGTDGDVGALILDETYREHWRTKVVEPRVRAGIAAPNEGADIFNYVPEYNVPNRLQLLGKDLVSRGHKLSRVEKIIGGNLLRVLKEVFV